MRTKIFIGLPVPELEVCLLCWEAGQVYKIQNETYVTNITMLFNDMQPLINQIPNMCVHACSKITMSK